MHIRTVLIMLCCILCAHSAQANTAVPAGFAPFVWVSHSAPAHNQVVRLNTTLFNASDESISGTVLFFVDDAEVARKPITVGAHESTLVTHEWTAHSGTHTITASWTDTVRAESSKPITIQNTTHEPVRISVAEPPPPTLAQTTINNIRSASTTLAPIVVSATSAALSATESARVAGATYLHNLADTFEARTLETASYTQPQAPTEPGRVLGTSIEKSLVDNTSNNTASTDNRLSHAALMATVFLAGLFDSKIFFYTACFFVFALLVSLLRFRQRRLD